MAGKKCVFASGPMAATLDHLTKNQLIDLVIYSLGIELQNPGPPDDEMLGLIEARMLSVWEFRKDRAVDLSQKYVAYKTMIEDNNKRYAAGDELRARGCEFVKREDRSGVTRSGWFKDDVFLSANAFEALNLLNGN